MGGGGVDTTGFEPGIKVNEWEQSLMTFFHVDMSCGKDGQWLGTGHQWVFVALCKAFLSDTIKPPCSEQCSNRNLLRSRRLMNFL